MRLARFLVALCVLALAMPALFAEEKKEVEKEKGKDGAVVATDKDNEGKITLKKGETLQVKLKFQGGTGFTWVLEKNEGKVLAPIGKPTTEAIEGEKPRPGGPRLMVFTFKAEGEGEGKLELHYKRPFEKGKEPAKTYKLTVTVK